MAKKARVTIKDVAREAGVAISTVSNVINDVGIVSERTKQKVLDAVEKLHYIPNMNAKLLKSKKRNTIGIFLNHLQEDFYQDWMQAIHKQCKENEYYLNIYISNDEAPDEIYATIVTSGVTGAIVSLDNLTDDYAGKIALVGTPLVFIDRERQGKNISSVVSEKILQASHKEENAGMKLGNICAKELFRLINDTGDKCGKMIDRY